MSRERKYLLEALVTGQPLVVPYTALQALVELAVREGGGSNDEGKVETPTAAWCEETIDRWLGENARRVSLWPTK